MRGMLLRGLMLLTLLAGTASAAVGAEEPSGRDAALEKTLQAMVATHRGKVSLYARDLKSGRYVALDADKPVQTASVIKLAILYEAMEQVRAGKVRWEDPVTLTRQDAVAGSGLLLFFDTPLRLTLKDVLTMMIVVSDNTATNLAIDFFGLHAINDRVALLGLRQTYLYKKIGKPSTDPMPADQPQFGLGKTTAREMEELMERIGLCELGPRKGAAESRPLTEADSSVCEVALKMLRNQFYRETIPRYLESLDATEAGSGTASKTGSLDAVRNDVAIVAGKNGPMVLSIFTYANEDHGWTVDNSAEVLIARLARAIVTTWSPGGIDGKTLVPGLGLSRERPGSVAGTEMPALASKSRMSGR